METRVSEWSLSISIFVLAVLTLRERSTLRNRFPGFRFAISTARNLAVGQTTYKGQMACIAVT